MSAVRFASSLVWCALLATAVSLCSFAATVHTNDFPGAVTAGGAASIIPDCVAVSPNGTTAYVCAGGDNAVLVVTLATGTVSASIPVGAAPLGIAISPDGGTIYVTNSGGNSVSVIDVAAARVKQTVTVGNTPTTVALTADGSKAYVADFSDGVVSVIDTATLSVSATIATGFRSESIAITPDGTQAVIANLEESSAPIGGSTVSVIDLQTGAVVQSIGVGDSPDSVAITPDGRTAVIANLASNSVSLIDLATASVTATVPVGYVPHGIAISPEGQRAYVVNDDSNSVTVLDLGDASISATVGVGGEPWAIALTPDGSLAYVVNQADETLSVVATATNSVVATIPLGPAPLAAAVLPGSRTVQLGATATVFATLLNSGTSPATDCIIGLPASASSALTMSYQTTDATTNAPTGAPNTPVDIAAGSSQSFVLGFQSSAVISDPGQPLAFTCQDVLPAPLVVGVDTVDLGFTATPTTDVIALAATAPRPGVVSVPASGGNAFAVATYNAGITGTLTVSADTGDAVLPLTAVLCPTDPSSAQCLQPPSASLQLSFAANATPTFSVFLAASGAIPFAPATNRVFVRFMDSEGDTHGSTSVAVEAQ